MWWWTLLGAFASAQDAAGQGQPAVSLTDDLEVRYWVMDDRLPDPADVPVFNYVEQVNRLNASVSHGDWTFEAQVDEVALFANQYILDGEVVAERQLLADQMFAPFATDRPGELNRFGYATLEKIRARVEKPHHTLVFGDTYAAFGRGIALNVNRNVDIDIDTSIQGAKGVFRQGAWDVTAVAGQLNRQQVFQDNPNRDITGDRRHMVAGVRVERFGLGPANVGAHVVTYDFVASNGWFTPGGRQPGDPSRGFDEALSPVDAVVLGSTVELIGVGGVDWFAEGDVFGFPAHCGGEPWRFAWNADFDRVYAFGAAKPRDCAPVLPNTLENERGALFFDYGTPARPEDVGYATYASASLYPGKTTVLVEFKRYYQAERVNALLATELYEVAVAPTLEYELAITEDTSAAVNSNDITGGRVRVDYAARPGEFVPYGSMAIYRDDDLSTLHFNQTPETIFHPVGGMEYIRDRGAAIVNAGYRVDVRDVNPQAVRPLLPAGVSSCNDRDAPDYLCDPGADRLAHGDVSIKFPAFAGLTGELQGTVQVWWWGRNQIQQNDFVNTTGGFTLQKGSDVAVTLFNDFTNNPLVNSVGNLPIEIGGEQPLYGAVEVMVKPTSALTFKAFGGAYKAGIRCSGGQCRQLPGFEGARFSMQGAF